MLLFLNALPMWVKVGAGMGLLMGVMWAANWWNTRDLKRDLASTQQKLEATEAKALRAAEDAARNSEREERNRLDLEASIARSNQRNAANAARIREVEVTATLAALRAVKEGQDAANKLLDPSTVIPIGPDALNEWQQQWKQRAGVQEVK